MKDPHVEIAMSLRKLAEQASAYGCDGNIDVCLGSKGINGVITVYLTMNDEKYRTFGIGVEAFEKMSRKLEKINS